MYTFCSVDPVRQLISYAEHYNHLSRMVCRYDLKQTPPKLLEAKQPTAFSYESHALLALPVVMHFIKTASERSVHRPFHGLGAPSDSSSAREKGVCARASC